MQSINIFDLVNEPDNLPHKFESKAYEQEEEIDDSAELLNTRLLRNELQYKGYVSFSILADEIYRQPVRIGKTSFSYFVMKKIYNAYYKESISLPAYGALVTLCKNDEAERVRAFLSDEFNMSLEQHVFDILKIIEESTDVRKAKFKVKIETVESVSVGGTRVSDTKYYERLFTQGKLNAVIVTFDTPAKAVTFRIDKEGKIFLYTQLGDTEILDLVEQLIDL